MNTRLWPLIALPFLSWSMLGATITGTIRDSTGNYKTNLTVTLRPISGAVVLVGTNYYTPVTQTAVTSTNGAFTFSAIVGDYTLAFGTADSQRVSVPDSTNSYDFIPLLNPAALNYVYTIPGAHVKNSSVDTTFGFLSDKLLFSGGYVSATTTNSGANEALLVATSYLPQPASANLTNWSSIATAAKQDASANLTNWSALATSAKADAVSQISLTHAGTNTLSFSAQRSQADLTLTGNVLFATANLAAGRDYQLFGRNTQASNCVPTWPGWRWTQAAPTNITAGKEFRLDLFSRGTVDTNVFASYHEAP